jgi:uncharacterized membrane protein
MAAPRSRLLLVYSLTLAFTLLWLAAIVLAPVLRKAGSGAAAVLYACFAPVCHQNPLRSFVVLGAPLAVCSRCFGIYAGFLAGTVFYPFRRGFDSVRLPGWRSFLLVSLPLCLDAGANFLGLWNTSNLLRFLLGFAWGTILPFYVLTALGELALAKLAIPAAKK